MSVRTDVINLQVNVNNNQSRNQLNELGKKAKEIRFEMDGLKKGTQAYIDKSKELKQVTAEMDALKKQIGITALNQKELNQELSKLKALRGSTVPFSKEFKDFSDQIAKVEKRLYDVKNGVQGFASFFSRIKDEVKQFGVMAAGYLGFQFLTSQFQNIIRGAGKLSDELADLQRIAGLTANEAENLNTKFKDLDTRTSTGGLREIAIIAGKLGVAKNDIFDFTKAVDQLVVSLGAELGNADQITETLGKILNVFDDKVSGDNITKLGNAFVELANSGVASAAFIADFDQRLSGIAKSAGIGLGELSGLGAGLEEMGARVESSSTAIQKLIISISADLPAAAKIAGMSAEKFTTLFNTNATEALLRYSEGLVKNKESFSQVTASLKDAGEEGARTIETISKLGTNADMLRSRIDLGAKSIKESTAITGAFALKNETLGAEIDKLGKKFNSLVTSSFVTDFVKGLISGFNALLEVFSKNNKALDEFKKQAQEVEKLEKSMLPLIDRVEELSKQSKLSKEEQIELNKAISAISSTIPYAITQFDKYGNAIGISTDKAREFINLQQAILKEKNRNAISDQQDLLVKLQKDEATYQQLLEVGARKAKAAVGDEINYLNRAQAFNISRLTAVQQRIQGIRGIIAELNGTKLAEDINAIPGTTKKTTTTTSTAPSAPAAKPSSKSDDSALKQLAKDKADFEAEIKKLKQDVANGNKTDYEREIAQVNEKYAALLTRAKLFWAENTAIGKEKSNEIIAIRNAQIELLMKKQFTKDSEKEYDDSLKALGDFFDKEKIARGREYADGKINKQEYEASLKDIEARETSNRLIIAKDYAANVKKAAADVTVFAKNEQEQQTKDAIAEKEKRDRETVDNKLAGARLKVLVSPRGSQAELEAKRAELELKFQLETEYMDKTSNMYLEKQAELAEAIKTLETDRVQSQIDQISRYANYFIQALTSLNQIINNKENRALQQEKARNDQKKKSLKNALDNKLISEAQYNKKVNEIQEEQDRKERELKRKQAKREKALNIFRAIVNVAAGVASSLSYGGPVGIALAAITAVLGALEIAAIASAPLPELGKGGMINNGPQHSDDDKGLHLVDPRTGRTEMLLVKGEGVLSKKAMEDNRVMTVTGTGKQIASAVNSANGGASFASGAMVNFKPMWMKQAQPTIKPGIVKLMAQGGIIGGSSAAVDGTDSSLAFAQLADEFKGLRQDMQTWQTKIKGHWVIKDLDDTRKMNDKAKKASGLTQ